ncbi:hypothetical protein [Solibacillus ferritrahens]|uniref:hypothetical protein n=1 Tax=Solibacillus ferritrahens TaxID=3098620 RepID=UPI00300B8F60
MTNYRLTPLRDTSKNKKRIMEHMRNNMPSSKPTFKRNWMPALIAVFTLVVAIFLIGPSMYQALFNKQDFMIEKVVFPEVAYTALTNSTYLDETNEFIYWTERGFYSFDVTSKQERLLVETTHWGYDYGVSENWVVWAQPVGNEEKLHVLNRQTNEVQIYETDYFYGIEVKDDTLIYMGLTSIDANSSSVAYKMMDLKTGEIKELRKHDGEGGNSLPEINGSLIVTSETVEMESGMSTVITVQDYKEIKDYGNYTVPYRSVQSLQLKGNHVYGYMWNEGDDEPFIGSIDMESGQFHAIKTSFEVHDFATDGEHFAVSVQRGDSDTVWLFENNDGALKRVSKLPSIKERLVLPRFTEAGTLVLNGEGPDLAMYLIRFK